MPTLAPPSRPSPTTWTTTPPPWGPPAPARNGVATAALVVGILALVGGLIPFIGWLTWPLSLVGLGLGGAALHRARRTGTGRGAARAGLATSALSLLAIVAWTVLLLVAREAGHDDLLDRTCAGLGDDLAAEVEAFRAAEGREPTSEAELLAAGVSEHESPTHDVVLVDGRAEVRLDPRGYCA